ncbi:DUF624 domain-containing protein [Erwinia sp. CPCC 100877]|nr:DUF624 domain-containing protein [Erwinia sp. CPCC 100877]
MLNKLNRLIYMSTLWLPRIILLNGLWLLGTLPLVTLARSTRVVVQLIERYLWQGFATDSAWRDFWTAYRENTFGAKRLDGLFSVYFIFASLNLLIFGRSGGTAAAFLWAFCFFLMIVASTIFLVQTVLASRFRQPVRFFAAFIYAGRHSKKLLFHWLITGVIWICLVVIGKLFLLLGGVALFIYLNLTIVKNKQKASSITEKS